MEKRFSRLKYSYEPEPFIDHNIFFLLYRAQRLAADHKYGYFELDL